jgi:hypothetical protein
MRGAGTMELHRFVVQRYFVWIEASKSRSGRVAAGQPVSAHGSNGMGADTFDEEVSLHGARTPWTGVVLDMAAGCNKPASPYADETVGRPRTPEDGPKRRSWDSSATPDALALGAGEIDERGPREPSKPISGRGRVMS